jgi:glycerophosphoryl diester phosphodiesterase
MVSDFTLEQIRKLRVKMRHQNRSQEFNLKFQIPTVGETCDMLQKMMEEIKEQQSRSWEKQEWLEARNEYVLEHGYARGNLDCGLYIETKRPSWYRSIGLPLEEKLVEAVEQSNFNGKIIIQSFELDSLARIEELKPEWPTVKLMTKEDVDTLMMNDGDLEAYLKHLKGLGLSGIGPSKLSIIPDASNPPECSILIEGKLSDTFTLVCVATVCYIYILYIMHIDDTTDMFSPEAHKQGLFVHPYTFKSDVMHLDGIYGGNASQEFGRFFKLGVDGVFADFPGHAVFARELYNRARLQGREFEFMRV